MCAMCQKTFLPRDAMTSSWVELSCVAINGP